MTQTSDQDNRPSDSQVAELFTAAEIAAYLDVEIEQFHVMAGNGDLRPMEIEGEFFYKVADVRRFLINAGALQGDSVW